MKPTKEQFEDYVRIRDWGVTNMYDISTVMRYSTTGLNKDLCIYIMQHFLELAKEYDVQI